MKDRILELAIKIQQIPAPTFAEIERAKVTVELFRQLSDIVTDVELSTDGNVYARIPGSSHEHPLVISAHLDTVFPKTTSLQIRIEGGRVYGPGLGDNSISVACLVAVAEEIGRRKINIARDIWLVANAGEEGLGDLIGMKKAVARFKGEPILYLVLEGLGMDHLIHQGIGVKRYAITAHSKGGHSWADFGIPSAIHDMSKLIYLINQISVPADPKTTFNVGRIQGGTSINTIAAEASIELDLRSRSAQELVKLDHQVLSLIKQANDDGNHFTFEKIGERASGQMPVDHIHLKYAADVLRRSGMEPVLMAGSTDANVPLSMGFPSFVMGITHGGGTHTINEFIETDGIEVGFSNFIDVVLHIANADQEP